MSTIAPFDRKLYNRIDAQEQPEVIVEQGDSFRLYFFDHNENLLGTRIDIATFVVEEGEYSLTGSVPIDTTQVTPQSGMLVAFYDCDNNFVLYEIKQYTPLEPDHMIQFYAEHAAMCELLDEVAVNHAITNGSAGYAVMKALEDTRWELEVDETTGTASTSLYYKSVWESLQIISEKWHCAYKFRWVFDGFSITSRLITVLPRLGADRGRRFELWKDINNASVTYDDSNVVTLVYGRGKGEQVGTTEDGEPTYGRRVTFEDIEWSVAEGDPMDKPLGREYIEDTAATELYGRCGRPRKKIKIFESVTDPEVLLQQTYEFLMANNKPLFDASLNVIDLERIYGFEHESVRVGDGILAIVDEAGIQLQATVKNISRNYIAPEMTNIQMGNYEQKSTDIQSDLMEKTNRALENSAMGADMVAKNKSLLQGVLDTMQTMIMSSGTKFTTDENDGSFIWMNDEETSAVKITGSGILISNERVGLEWQWSTALSGDGIVADTITSGVLQATLIKILGSNMFFWDSANIHIIDPQNSNNEIRIGQYDGTNYGIAFTRDGGLTWSTSIDFHGAHVSTQEQYSGVFASNYNLMYAAGDDGKIPAIVVSIVKIGAMTGSTRVTPVVSQVTGLPTGMTASIGTADQNYQVPVTLSVAKNATLGSSASLSGQITIKVTSPVAQDIIVNWTKVNAGTDGAQGQDGAQGETGAPGLNTAQIILFKRSPSAPAVPAYDLTYNFADGSITGDMSGWTKSIPDGSYPCYSTTAYASTTEGTAIITSSEWSTPTIAVKNGTDGTNGTNGRDGKDGTSVTILGSYDTYAELIADHPTGTAGDSYIVDGDLYVWDTTNSRWKNVGTIQGPAGQDGTNGTNGTDGTSSYLYVRYSANSDGSNMTTTPTSTSRYVGVCVTQSATAPTSYSQYTWSKYRGEDGTNGTDGYNRAQILLYKRAETEPEKPAATLTYTFQTGAISGNLGGWDTTIPTSDGNPCWVISYAAVATTSTVQIATNNWTTPVILVSDGQDGTDGTDGRDGTDGQDGRDGADGSKTFCQDEEPDPLEVTINDGDLWINTENMNKMYRWNEATLSWIKVSDMTVDELKTTLLETVADLQIAQDNISAIVGMSYVTSGDIQDLIGQMQSMVTQAADSLELAFNQTLSDTDGNIRSDISALIRASGDGVEVGRSDSNFKTRLTNDRLSFVEIQNTVEKEIAYISNHTLFITDAQVTNELAIGVGVHKLFKWRRTTNGLILIYQS